MQLRFDKMLTAFQWALLFLLTGLLLLQAFNTLEWRMELDTPLLHYVAFLMDKHDLVPYRDVFETSMPGTFAFHYLVGKLFGYDDVAFRGVDLVLLGALLAATYVFVSRFGRSVALWAVVLFGLVYLSKGQLMSLQRDYIGVIPIAFALLFLPARTDIVVRLPRFAFVGLLFGMSVLIKPHLGISLPVIFGTLLVYRWHSRRRSTRDLLKCGAVCGASFLVPVVTAVLWLAANSALGPFTSIFIDYLPLHTVMTGWQENITGLDRASYLIEFTHKLGGYKTMFVCSLFAYYRVFTRSGQDRSINVSLMCLFLCTLLYAVYPTLAGKFWGYHYMPFAYFCSISVGLCLFAWPRPPNSRWVSLLREALPLLILLIAVTVQLDPPQYAASSVRGLRSGPEAHAPKEGRVDEIAAWLESRLQPGDSVQPLDWTGGSIQAMLLAEAKLATRFMYDYHFYHHVSSPVIQELRKLFIGQLRRASPRFVIEVFTKKPWVSGVNSTRSFPELRRFLGAHYTVAFQGNGYLIYERIR